jgi:uncharacterized protein
VTFAVFSVSNGALGPLAHARVERPASPMARAAVRFMTKIGSTSICGGERYLSLIVMKRIAVSGATGFIGRPVVEALHARGDEVTALTRDPAHAQAALPEGTRFTWFNHDKRARAPVADIEADAIVHLAGERAVGMRWTSGARKEIKASRVRTTELIVEAIERSARRPSVLVCASGVDFYGDCGTEPVDERAPPGKGFLTEVTEAWEGAAMKAEALGVRVVRMRFGIVLGRGGGALTEMAMPFRIYMGGPIGTGGQYVSWVHLHDAVQAILLCLDNDAIRGPVNVTSPNSVTNAELATAIGNVLNRPSTLRVPALALRVRFGEGADPILTGRIAVPGVLAKNGFAWKYLNVEDAVREALG